MKQQRKGRTTNAHLDMMISSVKFIKTHETTRERKDHKEKRSMFKVQTTTSSKRQKQPKEEVHSPPKSKP